MKNLFILITLLLVQNIHSSNLNVANKTVAVITEEQKIDSIH